MQQKMPHARLIRACAKKAARRKKVIRKNGKRFYWTGKRLVRLKGNKKPPRRKK